eukprot:TRINITY_DN126_c0_g2_i1.p1 TRINITY_DN126_c0_g2~~TRINITY_DN126_c0_g2_i1.p1  ORF type:complete len:131 (+),score=10.29 TRINITY_DN126_c0_g2_i1:32-424(+)
MKILILAVITVALLSISYVDGRRASSGVKIARQDGPCTSPDEDWINCLMSAFQKGVCGEDAWCAACASYFTTFATCSCTVALEDSRPACNPQCTAFAVCSAIAAFNASMSCETEETDYTNCVNGTSIERP